MRLALVAALVLAVVLGARAKARVDIGERMSAYRVAARAEVVGPRRGLDAIPSAEAVIRDAEALAIERGLVARDLAVRIERDVTPRAGGAEVAARLGELPGRPDVDADGERVAPTPRRLRTTRVTLTGTLHGEGFLVSMDEPLEVAREIGQSL